MNDQDSMKILGVLKAHFSNPLTPAHLRELFDEFIKCVETEIYKARTPIFDDYTIGTQPYVLDYKDRKHIFVFNPSATQVTLTSNDNVTIPLPPQSWSNIGHRTGTRFTSSTVGVTLLIKHTDEVQP